MSVYQVDGACYETALAGATAVAARINGTFVTHTGSAYQVNVTAVNPPGGITGNFASLAIHFVPISGSGIQQTRIVYHLPCVEPTMADGIQIGWLVVAAWAATYAIMFLAKALRGETGGTYGSS